MKKKCKECGKTFEAKRKDTLFCRDRCRYAHNNKKKKVEMDIMRCDWCGKVFMPKSKMHHYCSSKCRSAAGNHSGRTAQKRSCMICGKIFEPFSNANIYCSSDCKKEGSKKNKLKRNREIPAYMQYRSMDFFPTNSGIPGVETLSADFCPLI